MLIRPARPEDVPALRACAQAAYAAYIPLIGKAPAPMQADFDRHVAAGEAHVATDPHHALQGYIVFRKTVGHMLLENVAVWPNATGGGIGRGLIQFCEDSARAANLRLVRLYTNAKMTANLSLYPHLGYVETDRRTEDGFDRIYFEKRLI